MTAFMPLAMEKDLRWLLMVTGSGSLSMRCTGVQETMARQQRSCRLKTRLGLQIFSMPCRISTIRESSVKDSMTLKLHRGLTSKKVMQFFSA